MVAGASRVLSIVAALTLLVGAQPAVCLGSSLWPFSSDSTTETKPKPPAAKPAPKPAPKPPSTLDKVVAAPKNLLTKVGDTLTGKKPAPPKTSQMVAVPKPLQPPKKPSKSWLPSLFQPKEPEKPKNVGEWLSKDRLDP